MKILHTVEFYSPSMGGAQEVVRQLSVRMAKMGHDVTVATTKLAERKKKLIDGVKIEEFDIKGNAVVGISGEVDRYQQFLVDGDFDVVMNYAAQQWATDLTYDVLDQIKGRKIIVPCGYSALSNPGFNDYFTKMPTILNKYDASVYLSGKYRDIDFARKHKVKNLNIIQNGADENEFKDLIDKNVYRKRNNINDFFIVTIGNHTGSKGHSEMIDTLKKLPFAATLAIIGHNHNDGCFDECTTKAQLINEANYVGRPKKRIMILEVSRPETINALKSADVFLFLSNIEASPIVLFEAAASAVPFVTTAAGNSAEIAKWTKGGIVVKTFPDELHEGNVFASIDSAVRALTLLYRFPSYRTYLGKRGRKNWQNNYTWGNITKKYLALYEDKKS